MKRERINITVATFLRLNYENHNVKQKHRQNPRHSTALVTLKLQQ